MEDDPQSLVLARAERRRQFAVQTYSTPPDVAARDATRSATLAAALVGLYPAPTSLVLELGCGHGHFLTAYATAHPSTPCLGVDKITKRVARSERKQQRAQLPNVNFLKAEALETLAALPAEVRLTGVLVLFPDPWPKQRHHRRRMLQSEMLGALAARAESRTWLALRTDHQEYFAWASEQIANHPAWHITPEKPWPFEHPTVFQELHDAHQSLMAARR